MSLNVIPMNSNAEYIIRNKLIDLEPSFDFNGMDNIVLKICCKDFTSFIEYLKETKIKINNRSIVINTFMLPVSEAITNLFSMKMCDELDVEDVMDDGKFLVSWIELWFKRYKNRVKLGIGYMPPIESNASKGVDHLSKFTSDEVNDIKKMVKFRLIESGEICGSTVLSDSLFIRVLNQYSKGFEWTIESKLNFTNSLIKETNRMIYTHGTLIFIKPSKGYGLREYRSDLGTAII